MKTFICSEDCTACSNPKAKPVDINNDGYIEICTSNYCPAKNSEVPMCGRLIKQDKDTWTPVEEGLPKERINKDYIDPSEHVLVQDTNGYMHVSRYWKYYGDKYGVTPWIDLKDYIEVVAWQPIPPRYEESGEVRYDE